jgi:hypothetical protein
MSLLPDFSKINLFLMVIIFTYILTSFILSYFIGYLPDNNFLILGPSAFASLPDIRYKLLALLVAPLFCLMLWWFVFGAILYFFIAVFIWPMIRMIIFSML